MSHLLGVWRSLPPMSNINVRARLDRISTELRIVSQYVRSYGGISKKDRQDVRLSLESIAENAHELDEVLTALEREGRR